MISKACVDSDADQRQKMLATDIGIDLVQQGGIQMVLQILMRHQSHAQIQQCGCCVLSSAAITKENRSILIREGGVHAIIKSLDLLHTDPSTHRWGTLALAAIGSQSASSAVNMIEAGAVSVLVRAMQLCADDADVQ